MSGFERERLHAAARYVRHCSLFDDGVSDVEQWRPLFHIGNSIIVRRATSNRTLRRTIKGVRSLIMSVCGLNRKVLESVSYAVTYNVVRCPISYDDGVSNMEQRRAGVPSENDKERKIERLNVVHGFNRKAPVCRTTLCPTFCTTMDAPLR